MSRDVISMLSWEDKEFFVQPPKANASIEEWEKWLDEDKKARTASKTAHTKMLHKLADEAGVSQDDFAQEIPSETTRKVGGVYKQGQALAFSGDSEEGTITVEPAVDPQQEKLATWARMAEERGKGTNGDVKGKQARRRARKAKKAKKKARRKEG